MEKLDKLKRLLEGRKSTYVEKTPNDVYRQLAEESELTPEEIAQIGGMESQHGKFEKPLKGGSARGLFQFQPKTAEHLEPGSSKSLGDINTQESLMAKSLKRNAPESPEFAFSLHNLGPTGGRKFEEASDDTLVADVVPENVRKSNPIYKARTVGEAKQLIKEKLKSGGKTSDMIPNLLDLLKEK